MQLNKQNILTTSDNGLDFFKFVILDLKQQGNRCKNVKNPFYNDTNASLSIFNKNGQWMYKDFGNESYAGDVFSFAAYHYNLTVNRDFVQILKNINRDLHLNLAENNEAKALTSIEKQLYHIRKTIKAKAIEYQKCRGLTKHQYFYQSNAYKNFPDAVIFINHNESGFERRFIASSKESQKLNLPKTQFFGTKANSIYIAAYNNYHETLFICEGPNNALAFVEIGYSAIATFGAANLPEPDLLKSFSANKIVMLAGDGDDAGDKFNGALAKIIIENDIRVKDLQAIVFPDNKDANDMLLDGTLIEYGKFCQIASFEQIKRLFAKSKEVQETDAIVEPIQELEIVEDDRIFWTPTLPQSVFDNIPEILKDAISLFDTGTERDVFLIGAIGVISCCLPNIKGFYFNKAYTAHLYAFVVASAGSGKGNMEWSKYFGQVIHDNIIESSKREQTGYEVELEQYDNLSKKEKQNRQKPVEPVQKMFFIPANSSASAFIQSLSDNNFHGLIFETEADTLVQSFKQEWGNFSDVLRKGFHHETTSMKRRKDNEYVEIKNPHIGIVLSGTPKQVFNLIPEVENGLFSRFLFYAFADNSEFKNPFLSNKQIDYESFFIEKGNQLFMLYNQLSSLTVPICFELTVEQGERFTDTFKDLLNKSKLLLGRDFDANIKRLGVITFRIAMIFSALRIMEDGSISSSMVCSDVDYQTAMQIALILEKHAIAVYQNMPKNESKDKKLKFFEALPMKFDRKTYIEIASQFGIQSKMAEKYMLQFKKVGLLKHEFNCYQKNERQK